MATTPQIISPPGDFYTGETLYCDSGMWLCGTWYELETV